MRRVLVLLAIVLPLAACGQVSGVHRFMAAYSHMSVEGASTAHGQSARTRGPIRHVRVAVHHAPVPGGRRVLRVRVSTSASTITWPQWAALLLDRLRAPRCANDLIVVVAWEQQEGTSAGWNPLATTYDMPGATTYNSAGVRNYPTVADGLAATVLTLKNGWATHGYGPIVRDLRACADPITTAEAVNASDWCRGCSNGEYVTGVVPHVIAAYETSVHTSS